MDLTYLDFEASILSLYFNVWLIIEFSFIFSGGTSLNITLLKVPPRVQVGMDVNLFCEVDLGHGRLYSLTWWKDKNPIYKYIPNEPKQPFTGPGIKIDVS